MISVNRTRRGVTISGLESGQKLKVQFPSTPQSKTYTASEQGIILVKELVGGVLPSKIEIFSIVYIPRGELDTLDFKRTPPKCFIYKGAIAVSGLEPGRNYEVHFPIPLEKQYVANSKGRITINSSKSNFLSDESVINVEDGGETRSYELGQVSSDNVVKPSDSAYKIGLVSGKDSFGFQAKKVGANENPADGVYHEIKPKYYTLGLKEITNYKGEKETVYAPVETEWNSEWGWNWDDIDGAYGRVHNGEILKEEASESADVSEDAIASYGVGGSAWVNGATILLSRIGQVDAINESELGGKKFFDYQTSFPWRQPTQEDIESMNQRRENRSNYFKARCRNFDDTAIDGSRCGHRSASSRSGGK